MDKVEAVLLNDGDIVVRNDVTVMFENESLLEVDFGGHDELMRTIWKKTGRVFTVKQLNECSNGLNTNCTIENAEVFIVDNDQVHTEVRRCEVYRFE